MLEDGNNAATDGPGRGDNRNMNARTVTAEPWEPDESLPPDLRAMRRFARLMDEAVAIPGTNQRVGLDAAIGLIPGVGDAFAALLSITLLLSAWRHRVPFRVLARMTGNVLLDLLIGAIPILGDAFDVVFRDNVKNVELLIRWRDRTRQPRGGRDFAAIFASIGVVILASVGVAIAVLLALVAFLITGDPR